MAEKTIALENIDPVSLWGINNKNYDIIKKYFPKIKLIARGHKLKVVGEQERVDEFEAKIHQIITFIKKYNVLEANDIEHILRNEEYVPELMEKSEEKEIIVYGTNGRPIKARTINQRKLQEQSANYDLIFAIGPAGTGKTYTAIALAVQALKAREVRKIILTRPAVEAEEHLGFLPGDLKDKLDPYLQPLYDALYDMIPAKRLAEYLEDGTVQIAPLAYMRGRTLNDAFVILDEAQNTTINQLKMFLTRMGKSSQFIVTGDITQIDLPKNQKSGLIVSMDILKNINGISFIHFDNRDIIRHKLVKDIVNAYTRYTDQE